MTRVIVAGALANKPGNGGEAWVRLTWALGLRRLGFDTYFIEQIDPAHCVDRAGRPSTFRRSFNRAYFRAVCAQFALTDRAARALAETHFGSDRVIGALMSDLGSAP